MLHHLFALVSSSINSYVTLCFRQAGMFHTILFRSLLFTYSGLIGAPEVVTSLIHKLNKDTCPSQYSCHAGDLFICI